MKAGFYEANITPPLDCVMPGYYDLNHKGVGIDEELYAKAVVVQDGKDTVAIVAIDACFITADIHDIVTKRISEFTDIKPDNVSISAVHTHKGVPIANQPELGLDADAEFTSVCHRKIADAVILASQRLQDVTITYDTVQVPGLAHNRTSIMPNGTYRTWISDDSVEASKLAGEDNTFTVMSFKTNEGKLIGSVSNFALHSDSTGHYGFYSGDYSSVISSTLKEKYGNDFVSVFLLGTCGDINHEDHHRASRHDPMCYHRVIGRKLGENAISLIENATPITKTGVKSSKELVSFKMRIPSYDEALKELAVMDERCYEWCRDFFWKNYFYYMAMNDKTERKLYLQCIRIGEVCIHFLPGEDFVETGLSIKEASPFEKSFVVELSNSQVGYVPTKRAFDKEKTRLYETSLAPGNDLVPEAADQFIAKSVELANKLL